MDQRSNFRPSLSSSYTFLKTSGTEFERKQVVDGGHSHTAGSVLPYPESVLNPQTFIQVIRDPKKGGGQSKLKASGGGGSKL